MKVYILGDLKADLIIDIYETEKAANTDRAALYNSYKENGFTLKVEPWAVRSRPVTVPDSTPEHTSLPVAGTGTSEPGDTDSRDRATGELGGTVTDGYAQ